MVRVFYGTITVYQVEYIIDSIQDTIDELYEGVVNRVLLFNLPMPCIDKIKTKRACLNKLHVLVYMI